MSGAIVLLSGGLDSCVALSMTHYYRKADEKILCLTFNYGSKHAEMEIQAARKICIHHNVKHRILELPLKRWGFKSALLCDDVEIPDSCYDHETMRQTVVPFRNGIML